MQVVILCGGKGTRMGKDLQGSPKALIPVGDKPIIWHIMKYYAHFGFNDFILCLGYKGKDIEKYFSKNKELNIKFLDTGLETNTGGRIKKAQKFINTDVFMATYGDGLSDINLKSLLKFHKSHKRIATLAAVRPRTTFGIVGIDSNTDIVTHFEEKPFLDHWINGGFFIFNRDAFKHIKEKDILEKQSF
ncbi:MAG: sugar phosphate nucleotidyltransferase, partial [Candidatus Omnitrophota bacterium]